MSRALLSKRSAPRKYWTSFAIGITLFLASCLYADERAKAPCMKGNFAVPGSQQPGPLVGFGENILDRNQTQFFLFAEDFIGHDQYFIDVIPSVLYGITDNFSVFFNLPIAAKYKSDGHTSSGLEDLFVQFEYAYFAKQNQCSSHQATLVGNIAFPTGSKHKNPKTGFGSISYFIGATYNYTQQNWVCFTSYGAGLTTMHHDTKFGNRYLYQFGLGRNIANFGGWLFAWIVEVDGTFAARDKTHGRKNPDSGGNVIYLTPSFWASSKHWTFQLGLGYAVEQHLFGHQSREGFLLAFNGSWTF
jgi:hypothetical protein